MEIPDGAHGYPTPPVPVSHLPTFQQGHSMGRTQQQQQQQPPPPQSSPTFGSSSQQQAAHLLDNTDRARAYKSRNKRPCDFCRYKKAACHLESQPPCELCLRYNKECTFLESPAKRRRPVEITLELGDWKEDDLRRHSSISSVENGARVSFSSGRMGSMDVQQDLLDWQTSIPPHEPGSMATEYASFDPRLYHDPMIYETMDPMAASGSSGNAIEHTFPTPHRSTRSTTSPLSQPAKPSRNLSLQFDLTIGEPAADLEDSSNAQIVGLSGASDPYLLSMHRYDSNNEANFHSTRLRKMGDDVMDDEQSIPTIFTIDPNPPLSRARGHESADTPEKWRREVEELVSDDVGMRLIALFFKNVQPSFPIFSRNGDDGDSTWEPQNISPCVLAAIYGHALPFFHRDEKFAVHVHAPHSPDALFRIARLSCLSMLELPNVSVVQTLLLLLQWRHSNAHGSNISFKWALMGMTVSITQAMGLNRDPSAWALPSWEIKLRKRLAWAVFIQEKWLALTIGRSSHIQETDWEVPPLSEDDFPEADLKLDDTTEAIPRVACQNFISLVELTVIVDDALRDVFSIKAARQLLTSLEDTLAVAKPLRIRLTDWKQTLPRGLLSPPPQSHAAGSSDESPGHVEMKPSIQHHQLDGNGSLHLAYITAKMELFRAMLRPKTIDANAIAVNALRTGALTVAKEISDFLESLTARQLNAFWPSCECKVFSLKIIS